MLFVLKILYQAYLEATNLLYKDIWFARTVFDFQHYNFYVCYGFVATQVWGDFYQMRPVSFLCFISKL